MFLNPENEMPINNKSAKLSALEYYKDYILNGRQIVLSALVYWDDEKLFRVEAPNFENEQEFYKQLASMMLLANTIDPCHMLIAFGHPVEYEDGIVKDSIVTVSANEVGFIAEPFPFDVVNEEVIFDEKITISDKQCYSNELNEIIAMGMKINVSIDFPSNVLMYLAEKDFDVQFFNDFNIESIDKTSLGVKF
jgi:hypothetical protein